MILIGLLLKFKIVRLMLEYINHSITYISQFVCIRFVRGSPYEVHRQAGWITAPISMLSNNDSLVDNVYYVPALITFSYVFSLLVLNLMSNGYLLWSCKRTKFDSAL